MSTPIPDASSTSTPLSHEDRHACAVCADWLATGRVWSGLAMASLIGFFVIGGLASAFDGLKCMPCLLIAIAALALVERVLAVRVAFDARLFKRLAQHEGMALAGLDQGLQAVMSVPASKAGRPVAARIRGAQRLYRYQVAASLLLMALDLSLVAFVHLL